jgi:hypothetical protein
VTTDPVVSRGILQDEKVLDEVEVQRHSLQLLIRPLLTPRPRAPRPRAPSASWRLLPTTRPHPLDRPRAGSTGPLSLHRFAVVTLEEFICLHIAPVQTAYFPPAQNLGVRRQRHVGLQR